MNTDAIFQKYWKTLLDLGIASEVDSAIALALRLAIQEAVDANAALVNDMSAIIANLRSQELVPESALVAAQNEVSMLRQQRGTLIEEAEQLRQQLAQLDADNATLTRKLAVANSHIVALTDRIHASESNINSNGHVKGTVVEVTSAEISARRMAADANAELADYWESLDKGRRTFRQMEKRIRLDLAQAALASFAELPTQAAFNAAKPEWMPTATGLCTAFGCKWEELPTLKWEQVKA